MTVNAFYRSQAEAIDVGKLALEDFGVLGLTASFQVTEVLRVYGRIENWWTKILPALRPISAYQ
jgi:outer membrane cobalamin receptor